MDYTPPKEPLSICTCGHNGDGPGSQHLDGIEAGHGACTVCPCPKFKWKEYTVAGYRRVKERRGTIR